MKFCDYGCGEEAKHQLKNGKWCCCKSWNSCNIMKIKNGNGNRGRKNTKETILLMSLKAKGRKHSEEQNEKSRVKMKDAWKNPNSKLNSLERGNKISKLKKENWSDPNSKYNSKECKEKQSKIMKEAWKNPKSKYNSNDYKEKQSNRTREKWKDIKYIQKVQKGLNLSPNKPESLLIEIFKNLNLEYEFTGDFSFIIDGKNPDFVNKKLNKIIEFFGRRYHDVLLINETPDEHEKNRINHFLKNGYDCMIIWEEEILDIENLKKKIVSFSKE